MPHPQICVLYNMYVHNMYTYPCVNVLVISSCVTSNHKNSVGYKNKHLFLAHRSVLWLGMLLQAVGCIQVWSLHSSWRPRLGKQWFPGESWQHPEEWVEIFDAFKGWSWKLEHCHFCLCFIDQSSPNISGTGNFIPPKVERMEGVIFTD